MYKLFLILTILFPFGNTYAENLSKTQPINQFTMLSVPEKLPQNAQYYQADGKPVLLSYYKGKVVVLNFFKATCLKCLIEMPSLNQLKDRFGDDVVVLAVSQGDESAEIIDNVLHKQRQLNNISVSLDDHQKLFFSVGGEKVPQTRLIDKNGFIRGSIKGEADFLSDKLIKQIENILSN